MINICINCLDLKGLKVLPILHQQSKLFYVLICLYLYAGVMLNSTVPLYGPGEGERERLSWFTEHFNEVLLARGADGPERVGTSF